MELNVIIDDHRLIIPWDFTNTVGEMTSGQNSSSKTTVNVVEPVSGKTENYKKPMASDSEVDKRADNSPQSQPRTHSTDSTVYNQSKLSELHAKLSNVYEDVNIPIEINIPGDIFSSDSSDSENSSTSLEMAFRSTRLLRIRERNMKRNERILLLKRAQEYLRRRKRKSYFRKGVTGKVFSDSVSEMFVSETGTQMCGSPSERDAAESECVRQSGDMEKSLSGSQTWKFRYERHPPERQKDSQHKEEQKTRRLNREGRLVTFYRNGDPFFAGLKTSVSQKSFLTIETLLKWLNSKIPTTAGIYYIFSLPDGHDVQKLADFRGGGSYVVSSTKTLIHVDYGLAPNNKGTRKGSKAQTGPAQKAKNYVQQSTSGSYPASKPRLITVISNSNREMREKLILNPKTTQNFEDLPLLKGQPVRALYTSNPPHVKVESYSQLFREFKDHTTFIACGDELLPFEVTSQIFSRSMSDDGDFAAGQAENPTGKAAVQKQFRAPEGLSRSLAANEAEDKNKTRSSLTEPATDRLYVKGSGAVRVEIQGVVKELFPPTVAEAVDDGGKPAKKLELEWVYGYKWRNIKHNLEVFSTTGELVYCVGTVVIFCNKNNEAQRHYQGHNEDVTWDETQAFRTRDHVLTTGPKGIIIIPVLTSRTSHSRVGVNLGDRASIYISIVEGP